MSRSCHFSILHFVQIDTQRGMILLKGPVVGVGKNTDLPHGVSLDAPQRIWCNPSFGTLPCASYGADDLDLTALLGVRGFGPLCCRATFPVGTACPVAQRLTALRPRCGMPDGAK